MASLCRRLKPSFFVQRHLRSIAPPLLRVSVFRHPHVTFAAAAAATSAQPQLDPDYYWDNVGSELQSLHQPRHETQSAVPMVDSEGCIPLRGVQWVFIGSPSAKKHVYADKLSKLLQVPHISMIANALNHGMLAPEEIIFGLLSERLEDGSHRGETGFILDGIPRTQIQAEILDHLVDIDLVVNFQCREDWSLEHYGRGNCATRIGMASKGSQSEFIPNEESIWKKKVHVNAKQLKSLEDYYRKQKKLLDFQVGNALCTW